MTDFRFSTRLDSNRGWTRASAAAASALHLAAFIASFAAYHMVLETVNLPDLPRPQPVVWLGLDLALPGRPVQSPPRTPKANPPPANEPVQPIAVPDTTQTQPISREPEIDSATPSDHDIPPGEDVGDPAGPGGGGEGAGGDGPPGGGSLDQGGGGGEGAADPDLDSNITRPEPIDRPDPDYPRIAQVSRIEGVVRLHVVVGLDGSIESLAVKDGNPILAEAARAAVQRWRYTPARRNGQPVRVFITVRVSFSLR